MAELKEMVDELTEALSKIHSSYIDLEMAKKNAALALLIQIELSKTLSSLELNFKLAKNNVDIKSSEVYFKTKGGFSEKKLSEAALQQYVAANEDVNSVKKELAEIEKDFKEHQHLFNICRDAHTFFRQLGQHKNEWNM